MDIKNMLLVIVIGVMLYANGVTAGGSGGDVGDIELTPKEQLGELLYFDENLSINRNQACASCHLPPAFVDPANTADPLNSVVSLGSDITLNGGRNAPSAGYAAFSPFFHWDPVEGLYIGGQFWDGRANTLTDQAKGPFLNPVEMAMPSKESVLRRIASRDNKNRGKYKVLWELVYNVEFEQLREPESDVEVNALYDMMADAIAAFEKTRIFSPFTSKFDYFLAGKAELTEQELKGRALYEGKAQCNACHPSKPMLAPDGSVMPPLFTDFTYDNIGVPKSQNPLIVDNPVDLGLGGRPDIAARDSSGAELGKHKVMSLRNIAVTPPYAHNGFFTSLEDIVHFYNTRDVSEAGWPAAEVPENVNTNELGDLGLTPEEEADIVAFLKTLTDGYGPVIHTFPFPPFP
ncbi:cytochrome-c peroxidase [Kaarinaea lacus]